MNPVLKAGFAGLVGGGFTYAALTFGWATFPVCLVCCILFGWAVGRS